MSKYPTTGEVILTSRSDEPHLRIGELAERTGLTQRAIRYYEELGLLPLPGRTDGDFRLYSEADVARLHKIIRLRDLLGFSLAEVGEILRAEETLEELRSQYHTSEDDAGRLVKLDKALMVVNGQIELVGRKIDQLIQMRSELDAKVARYRNKKLQLSKREAGMTRKTAHEKG